MTKQLYRDGRVELISIKYQKKMHSGNNRVRKKVYREFAIKIIIVKYDR